MNKAQSHSLPSEENIALRRLDNGILLAARENFSSPAVIMAGLLEVGSMDESVEKSGLASLTASLLSRGTERFDYDTLNDTIEGVGASLSAGAGTHTTRVGAKSLAEDFPMILELASEMLRHPTFPEEHLERVRAQRVTGLRERLNNARAVAEMTFYQAAYPPDHPYHHDSSGTPESVLGLTRDDLVAFHRAHYGPEGAIFVVVGAIPKEEALDRLAATFGDWAPLPQSLGNRQAPPVEWPEESIQEYRAIPGKTQSDILYGLPTVHRTHPDFMALQLANTVLGVFGMMGRIGKSVRDEQGLAYYARSGVSAARGPGAWTASAGVSPDKVDQAVQSMRAEWVRMGTELVSEGELNDSKTFITASLPLRLESNEGVARTILDMLYYDLGLGYLEQYQGRVQAISAEEVRRVSETYFDPERAILSVAGPPLPQL